MKTDYGQGKKMTLTLINYIPSLTISYLYVATFMSRAAIVSIISIVTHFPILKPMFTKLTLP